MIRWGYYTRSKLPEPDSIKIQRIRCQGCHLTTNVLPSFLLAHKSYHVHAVETLLNLFIDQHHCWKQSPDFPMDISTAYRWLRCLRVQVKFFLPRIRKALLELAPEMSFQDNQAASVLSDQNLFSKLLILGEQLYMTVVRLNDNKDKPTADVLVFLNSFLASDSGKPLLVG
jgi:transposase-like protein